MSETPQHSDSGPEDDSNKFSSREYRLVPVDDWHGVEHNKYRQQVNFRELGDTVWNRRRFIFKFTALFIILGLLIALLSPVEYKSEATLLPENQSSMSGAGGLLKQYGGLLGINGGNLPLDQQESIPPKLYPDIVNSLPFQLEILNKQVRYTRYDTTVTNYAFFDDIYSPSAFGYLKEYTIGLPGKIVSLFNDEASSSPLPKGFAGDSIITVTKRQALIINEMRGRISVVLDEESGLINVTVEMPDPNAVAEIGQLSVNLLKEYITNYRTRKASEDLEFTQEQMLKAKEEFQNVQLRLAEFQDSNFGQLTAKAETRQQRLQSEYDLAFNKYNSLAQQVEQAKLRVQEKTPVVTVLKPVQMPVDNYKPKRRLIVILSLFLGLILSAGYIIVSELMQSRESKPSDY